MTGMTGRLILELRHPSDPRYLVVDELPARVTIDDLETRRYGKLLVFAPGDVDAIYEQPDGFGTEWVKPR